MSARPPLLASPSASPTWQSIQAEAVRRISERIWQPGELIPGEVELATEFGCARATVNRALRQLADAGLLDRRRKAGTRVTRHPVRKATLDISITRQEVEQRGHVYGHKLLERKKTPPPSLIRQRMKLSTKNNLLHLRALHLADNTSFAYEDRWINVKIIPGALKIDFSTTNANEWLLENAPFTNGDIAFSAANTSTAEAKLLQTKPDTAIFTIERTTWNGPQPVTTVRLAYAPGFQMQTTI